MARGIGWPKPKKARTLKRARQLNEKMGFRMAFQQAADESGIPEETIISWHQKAKAEAQEKEKAADWYRGSEGKTETSTARFPIVEPEPVIPHVSSDTGQLRCSRCRSTKHLVEQDPGLYFCTICRLVLPYEPTKDYEMKYRESKWRSTHWMA